MALKNCEIKDEYLNERLRDVAVDEGRRIFSQTSEDGLHVIGVDPTEEFKHKPDILAIPGFCHGNWSFIKLIKYLAEKSGVGFTAISPPGEAQSRPMNNSIEKWSTVDYEKAYQEYIQNNEAEVVLLGYSIGGLHALRLSATEEVRDQIKGVILINPVKPSNICHRKYNVETGDARSGEAEFLPKKSMNWITEALFNGKMPKDPIYAAWVLRRLMETRGSNNTINTYRGPDGEVDPRDISINRLIEVLGREDNETVAGVYNPDKIRPRLEAFDIIEAELEDILNRRIKVSDVLSGRARDLNGTTGLVEAKSFTVTNGSHASLLQGDSEGDQHVIHVAQIIADHYEWLITNPDVEEMTSA